MTDHGLPLRPRGCNHAQIAGAVVLNHILAWLIFTRDSHSNFSPLYVDPGSGLLMWQLLAATAVGLVFNIKSRVARYFKKGRSGEND